MTKTKNPAAPAKTKEPKLKLNVAWAKLFSDNEKVPKAKRLTDDQLVREMQKLFPQKKDRTTITRVNMVRAIYNKGTNLFKMFGEAKTLSRRYDENGDVIDGRVAPQPQKKAEKVKVKTKAKVKVKAKTKPKAVAAASRDDGDDADMSAEAG